MSTKQIQYDASKLKLKPYILDKNTSKNINKKKKNILQNIQLKKKPIIKTLLTLLKLNTSTNSVIGIIKKKSK
jgi:hypothetical protein